MSSDLTGHSVYLDDEYERMFLYLKKNGFSFTKMVKAIILAEYDIHIKDWAEEQLEIKE